MRNNAWLVIERAMQDAKLESHARTYRAAEKLNALATAHSLGSGVPTSTHAATLLCTYTRRCHAHNSRRLVKLDISPTLSLTSARGSIRRTAHSHCVFLIFSLCKTLWSSSFCSHSPQCFCGLHYLALDSNTLLLALHQATRTRQARHYQV